MTVLAPCVWPLLPAVLSSAAPGGIWRPFGVVTGIVVSFATLTLALSYLVRVLGIDPNVFRYIAAIVLGLIGLFLIIPSMTRLLESGLSRVTPSLGRKDYGSGWLGGLVTGLSLGVAWTPCAGPILGSIATASAVGRADASIVAMVVSYSLGMAIPLLVLAVGGQRVLGKTRALSPFTLILQRVFGVVIVLTAVAILLGYDKVLSSRLLDLFPQLASVSAKF